jgi:DNA gyrase/topoisomerase IV subunit B
MPIMAFCNARAGSNFDKQDEEAFSIGTHGIGIKATNIFSKKFKAETFEYTGEDMRQVANRQRIDLPDRLPTFGLKPKKIREGQMIGMYESKQDLYLISAQIYNKLQNKIDELEGKLSKMNKK